MKSELIKEEWRPIPGYFELYDASNFGRVRSLDHWKVNGKGVYIQKGRILKPGKKAHGYLQVGLSKGKIHKYYSVHRLVWEAFNGEIPEGMEVNHINEIKSDNSLWNLNLMSHIENINYGTGNQRAHKYNNKNSIPLLQLTLDGELVREWPSANECQRNGFHQATISACIRGEKLQYRGFKWVKKT